MWAENSSWLSRISACSRSRRPDRFPSGWSFKDICVTNNLGRQTWCPPLKQGASLLTHHDFISRDNIFCERKDQRGWPPIISIQVRFPKGRILSYNTVYCVCTCPGGCQPPCCDETLWQERARLTYNHLSEPQTGWQPWPTDGLQARQIPWAREMQPSHTWTVDLQELWDNQHVMFSLATFGDDLSHSSNEIMQTKTSA